MLRVIKQLLIVVTLTLVTPILATDADLIFLNDFESARLIHRWTFSETGGSGTTLLDSIGNAHGKIVEAGASAATVGNGEVKITGGVRDSADYAELPAGLLSDLQQASIEIWATQEALQIWGRIFDVGSWWNNSLTMTWSFSDDPDSDRLQWSGASTATLDDTMAPYVIGYEYQIVITIDRFGGEAGSTRLKLYLDGVFKGYLDTNNRLSELDDQFFWLARSQYTNDPTASASYNELSIWEGVLSEDEVAANWEAGPVGGKMPRISVNIWGPDELIRGQDNLAYMTKGVISSGASVYQGVRWTSSDPTVIRIIEDTGKLWIVKEGQVTITATSLADPSASASKLVTAREPKIIHQWTFNESGGAGTVLKDIVGGADGTIVDVGVNNGSAANGMVMLAGGAQNASDYISLPDDVLLGLTDTTIELWATPQSVKAWARVFDFGPDTLNYLMLSWTQGTDINTDRFEWSVDGNRTTGDNNFAPFELGRQYHIGIRIDGGGLNDGRTLVNYYLDGEWVGPYVTSKTLADIVAGGNWLGRSKYGGDETANASYNELRIYDGAFNGFANSFAQGPVGGTAVVTLDVTGPSTIEVGTSVQLSGTVMSTVGTVSQAINWSSSTPASASVSAFGWVTALAPGAVTITASSVAYPNVEKTFNISVVPAEGPQAVTYDSKSDRFYSFRKNRVTVNTWLAPFPDSEFPVVNWSGWPTDWGSGDVDAVVYSPENNKYYLFKGDKYARHSANGALDPDYPAPITPNWDGWPPTWGTEKVDAVVYSPENKKFYLFKGDEYARHSFGKAMDAGYPKKIAESWVGWPPSWGSGDIGAATYYPGNKKFYLFKGSEYARHSLQGDMDSGYPVPYDSWGHNPPQTAQDLVGDFWGLKNDYDIEHWTGLSFPNVFEDSRFINNHIQGITQVSHGRWVLSHSQDNHPGFLHIGNADSWGFYINDSWGKHPGAIQASGSTVAVPFTDYQEIRFFHVGPKIGTATKIYELIHLQIPEVEGTYGTVNSVGFAYYPPDQRYYIIAGTVTTANSSAKLPIYRSHRGKSLTDPTNKFELVGTTSNKLTASESGIQLIYDEKTNSMYMLTLSRVEDSSVLPISTHRAILTKLDMTTLTGDEIGTRQDFKQTTDILTDPSFRFGAGAVLDSAGRLNLIATERCIPPRTLLAAFLCGVDLNPFALVEVDYFILTP